MENEKPITDNIPKKPKHQLSPERIELLKDITKRKDTEAMKSFIIDEKKIEADIQVLNKSEPAPVPRQLSSPGLGKPPGEARIRMKPSKPLPDNTTKEKIIMKPSSEQIHILVHTVVQGATTLMNKEDVTKEEDKAFSEVLYDIGDQLGWWNTMEFMPYLILVFSGIDLGLTIMKKPPKRGRTKPVTEVIVDKVERVPSPTPNVKFDVVDEAALMQKLGGNNIYDSIPQEEI